MRKNVSRKKIYLSVAIIRFGSSFLVITSGSLTSFLIKGRFSDEFLELGSVVNTQMVKTVVANSKSTVTQVTLERSLGRVRRRR